MVITSELEGKGRGFWEIAEKGIQLVVKRYIIQTTHILLLLW